jgi:signal transduction histidine kinase
LYWHQVITGWSALAFLWTAAVFAHEARWKNRYLILIAFPPLWSYIAIYRLQNFLLAAAPAVAFLSVATAVTGVVFWRHRRGSSTGGATVLAVTFFLWAIHHLDYPVLRARGIWTPWGYYLDSLFTLCVGAGILLLINSELTERLRARTEELELLSRKMVRQHEGERRRLSLALHDETAQVFAALKLRLGSIAELVEPDLRQKVDNSMRLVDDGMARLRNLTDDLRPSLLDDLGLLPALRSLVANFAAQHGSHVQFNAPDSLPALSPDADVVIYRATQEGLAYVTRHAGETRVIIHVTVVAEALLLTLKDEGRGFDAESSAHKSAAAGRMGLAGMHERAAAVGGQLQVTSAVGQGVALTVRVPLAHSVTHA